MSDTSFTAFVGDRERTLRLSPSVIAELERLTGAGIGTVYQRVAALHYNFADLVEIIRLALVGGGASPAEGKRLVDAYVADRPLTEIYPIAMGALSALWHGPAPASEDNQADEGAPQ